MINSIQLYFTQFNTKISLLAILGQQGLKNNKNNNNNSSKLLTDFPSRKSVKKKDLPNTKITLDAILISISNSASRKLKYWY